MNNPNPFIPQGSLLEQKNRKRSRFQIAVFGIFVFNVLVIAPMLIQGCKRDTSADGGNTTQTPDNSTQVSAPPADTNTTITAATPTTNPVTQPPIAQPPVTQPPPAVTQPATTATEYVIVKGDTLDAIHKKFSVSVKAIEDANPGIVPTKLHQGQKIQIPAPMASATSTSNATVAADGSELYVVKAGDNLSTIAKNHHTTVKGIETLNNLKTTRINVGDKLKMPTPGAAPAPPASTIPAPAPAPTTAPAAPAPPSN
jgi:LysM repeat protein